MITMKIYFRTIATSFIAGMMALGTVACEETPGNDVDGDDRDTASEIEVSMSIDGAAELTAAEGEELKLNVTLETALEEDLVLTFEFVGGSDADGVSGSGDADGVGSVGGSVGETGVVEFAENPVTILAGETAAMLTVRPIDFAAVTETRNVKVTLKSASDENASLAADVEFTLLPPPPPVSTVELTEEQEALIEGYRETLGIDLMHWIGEVPFEAELVRPADEFTWGMFLTADDIEFSGTTTITLSDNATADKPVLKMTSNAMGLSDYLYIVFLNNTLYNIESWVGDESDPESYPYSMSHLVVEAAGISDDTEETFDLALDNIAINDDATLDYISEFEWAPGLPIETVDFVYTYSAWEQLQEVLATVDETSLLKTAVDIGFTLDPSYYMNTAEITENSNEYGNWVAPASSYDTETGKMSFTFPMNYCSSSTNYMTVKVTYGSAE